MGWLEPCYLQGVEMAASCVVGCREPQKHRWRSWSLLPKSSLLKIAKCMGGLGVGEEACSPTGPYSEGIYCRIGAMALG